VEKATHQAAAILQPISAKAATERPKQVAVMAVLVVLVLSYFATPTQGQSPLERV
jgi:hypothetical protein